MLENMWLALTDKSQPLEWRTAAFIKGTFLGSPQSGSVFSDAIVCAWLSWLSYVGL